MYTRFGGFREPGYCVKSTNKYVMKLKLLLIFLLHSSASSSHPGLPNVTKHSITQNIDHFGYDAAVGSYQQRYFTYEGFVKDAAAVDIVFFYCGNEDNVELYVNNTGLMWELGKKMNTISAIEASN